MINCYPIPTHHHSLNFLVRIGHSWPLFLHSWQKIKNAIGWIRTADLNVSKLRAQLTLPQPLPPMIFTFAEATQGRNISDQKSCGLSLYFKIGFKVVLMMRNFCADVVKLNWIDQLLASEESWQCRKVQIVHPQPII